MSIIAIDPGPSQSAVVDYDPHRKVVLESRIEDNERVLKWLRQPPVFRPRTLVIENMAIPTVCGREIFNTCIWIGRFIEAWGPGWNLIDRKDVKMHLCGSMRAKDPHIRQALIDKFGGKKACEGPIKLSDSQDEALHKLAFLGGGPAAKIKPATLFALERQGLIRLGQITAAGREALAGTCGPLHGISTHKWSALAVAVVWAETHENAAISAA